MNSTSPGRPSPAASFPRLVTSTSKYSGLDIPVKNAGEEPRDGLVLRIPFLWRRVVPLPYDRIVLVAVGCAEAPGDHRLVLVHEHEKAAIGQQLGRCVEPMVKRIPRGATTRTRKVVGKPRRSPHAEAALSLVHRSPRQAILCREVA